MSDGRYEYAKGGQIPGEPVLMAIDPDECIINHDLVCIRPGHPTSTSDGTKPNAFWRCDGNP